MPKMFLRRAHPGFFISYQGATVAALGTGLASAAADPIAPTPPLLSSFYDLMGINAWGWIYVVVGLILVVGLYVPRVARWGLFAFTTLLIARLGLQIQQGVILWHGGATWRELLPTIAGLPILYGFVSNVIAMTAEPFTNPASSPDMTVIEILDDKP